MRLQLKLLSVVRWDRGERSVMDSQLLQSSNWSAERRDSGTRLETNGDPLKVRRFRLLKRAVRGERSLTDAPSRRSIVMTVRRERGERSEPRWVLLRLRSVRAVRLRSGAKGEETDVGRGVLPPMWMQPQQWRETSAVRLDRGDREVIPGRSKLVIRLVPSRNQNYSFHRSFRMKVETECSNADLTHAVV